MKIKLIDIDTTDENFEYYVNNLELYDLIVPNIVFLVGSSNEVFMSDEIDWDETRKYFEPTNNGHCICFKGQGYTAAPEFEKMAINLSNFRDYCWANTLSELSDELAEMYDIKSWKGKLQTV